jgi:hypothetical protein
MEEFGAHPIAWEDGKKVVREFAEGEGFGVG